MVAAKRHCRHDHDLSCALAGPFTLSRPAFSPDLSVALVHAEEPVGSAGVIGRFFLLERRPNGWIVVAWRDVWARWTDDAGQIHDVVFDS